ncbi:MAG: serine hydrolase [Chthoniobacterales bacterium]|nr:serine hydrolase [Chthoniobacterales bacterium]
MLIANALLASDKATPDSPAGQLSQKWLSAYNAADEAALRSFVEEHYTPEARSGRSAAEIAEGQLEGRQVTQGLDVVESNAASPAELDVLLKSRGTFIRFLRLSLKLNESGKIAERRVAPAPPPAEAGPRLSVDELAKELDAKLTELTAKDEFSGAALIGEDDKPVWQKAYGMADREKKLPATLETRFRLGSMPKMFTSVAIAQLVDATPCASIQHPEKRQTPGAAARLWSSPQDESVRLADLEFGAL